MRQRDKTGPRAMVRRTISASPEEVFAAWTDADGMREWMSPVGTASMEMDLRVGGEFRLVMSGGGMEIKHVGVYTVIQPPIRLQFTWRSEFTGLRDTLVTVDLTPIDGGKTELLLTHERLSEEESVSHGGGWSTILDRLDALLSKGIPRGC